MNKSFLICVLLSLVWACDQSPKTGFNEIEMSVQESVQASAEMSMSGSMPGISRSLSSTPPPADIQIEKKIIRTGNMTLRTKDLAGSRERIDSLALKSGGYISSENFNDHENQTGYNISYRIPAEKFDSFLAGIESGGEKIENKSINSNDVTEQYYDVKIRLENERKVEQRYLELLKQARTVKDILDIEEKLGRVRQEIESKEGRLRYLDSQVGYSTLNVFIYQKKDVKYEPEEKEGFGQRLVKAIHRGWLGFVDVVLFFLGLWPLWLVALLTWRSIIWFRKRRKHVGE